MNENDNGSSQEKPAIRPAILVDEWILQYYATCIRKILVGLTGSAYGAIVAGPKTTDMETILYPSVVHYEYPEIKLRLFNRKNQQLLLDKLSENKPTILHGFWPGDVQLLSFLSETLRLPAILTLWEPLSKRKLPSIGSHLFMAASSEPIYQGLLSLSAELQPRTLRIPLGVYVEKDQVCFGVPNQATSMVICEELRKVHHYEPLLNAIRHLLADGFEFSLAIMGEGPAERAIRKHIRELGLSYVVTLVPPLRPVRPIFEGMDIFIHLKDRKRCNLALMEAMSVGLAVAGCADSTTGLMQNEKTALLFDPIEEMSIYACLKQLLSRHELARTLAQNAQDYLQTHNSVSHMVSGYLEAYTTALKNPFPTQEKSSPEIHS